jgi:hypothetical protein
MADSDKDAKNQGKQRRPYEPPAIEQTSEFETLALACGPFPGGGPDCDDPDEGVFPGS